MYKKIVATLIVLIFCAGCLSMVSADNSTNETLENNESEMLDMSNYILPVSVSDNGIEFSDGFTGFYLDLTKDSITTDDKFVRENAGSDEIHNYVKLAIVEAYRQGCEHDLANIIDIFAAGSFEDSDNEVVAAVLKSDETIGDSASVDLEDSIEGDFEFELLKDADGEKSDCIAYKVSLKEMPDEAKLAAIADENATGEGNDTSDNLTEDNETADSQDNRTDETQDENKTADATDNRTDEKSDDSTDNKTDANDTAGNKTDDKKQNNETSVTETNKTIINKTTTVTINENNTTTINVNNNKVINKTNETPQNATLQDTLMRTVGNPIFILVVVFAILACAGSYMRKKGN